MLLWIILIMMMMMEKVERLQLDMINVSSNWSVVMKMERY